MDDNNDKSTIPEGGTATTSTTTTAQYPKATSLHPRGATAEREESRVLLVTPPRVEVLAV